MKHALIAPLVALAALVAAPLDAEKSKRPTEEQWKSAAPLELPRPHELCTAARIEEWVRVTCRSPAPWDDYFGARTVGGAYDEVTITDRPNEPGEKGVLGVRITFPVRRGDRRLIQLSLEGIAPFRSYRVEEEMGAMISALWLPEDAEPTITVY